MLADPNIVFLLCAMGVLALLAELANPGFEFIGIAGVICLALGGYALAMLGVNGMGVIPILISAALYFHQIRAREQWIWTSLAALLFIVGILIMFNSPSSDSPPVSIPLVVLVSVGIAGLNWWVLRVSLETIDLPVVVGTESLVGKAGVVRKEIQPEGLVYVAGEEWTAVSENENDSLEVGDRVTVTGVEGLRLRVRPGGGEDS